MPGAFFLKKRDCYGYEISEFLSGHIDISDGTVYPILRKLKADGMLTTYLQEESGGPPRKYYKLTELGLETYEADRALAGRAFYIPGALNRVLSALGKVIPRTWIASIVYRRWKYAQRKWLNRTCPSN